MTGISDSNVALKFVGEGYEHQKIGEFLRKFRNYSPEKQNRSWVILKSDPEYSRPLSNVLTLHSQIPLKIDKLKEISIELNDIVPKSFDERRKLDRKKYVFERKEKSIQVDLYSMLAELSLMQREGVESHLENNILPFMIEKMDCTLVTSISVDPDDYQTLQTVVKFMFLLSRHKFEDVENLVFKYGSLNGILPNAFSPISYVGTLTRLAPLAFTLPVSRDGCAWHFQTKAMWHFPHVYTTGIFQHFIDDLNPYSEEPSMLGLTGITGMSERNIWRYLRLVVDGMNGLFRYLYDMKNFADSDTKIVNFGKQIQAIGAVDLIFSDLSASNYSTSSYSRQFYAMSILDKIANLKKSIGNHSGSESKIFEGLLSEKNIDVMIRIIEEKFISIDGKLSDIFKSLIRDTYENVSSHYARNLKERNPSNITLGERVRNHRNLRHGTFLTGQQFDKIFSYSDGSIPKELIKLVFLMVLCLVLSPSEYIALEVN